MASASKDAKPWKVLESHIRNKEFRRAYLLTGDEPFLLRSYKKKLRSAIAGDDGINYSCFEGMDIDINAVIDVAETMPFFSDRRLIVIENSGWCKSGGDAMADYLARACETSYFVFIETAIDRRSSLYRRISEAGCVCELNHPAPDDLFSWAARILMQAGKQITRSDLEIFLDATGNDMELVKNELEKLIAYVGTKDNVNTADIEAITTVTLNNKVYDMCKAITQKKNAEAMRLYEDLLALRESPMSILYKIARQFNQLLQVRDLTDRGCRQDAVAEKLRVSQYIAGRLMKQARGYDRNVLVGYVERCLQMEEAFKTGEMPERLAVELLICG